MSKFPNSPSEYPIALVNGVVLERGIPEDVYFVGFPGHPREHGTDFFPQVELRGTEKILHLQCYDILAQEYPRVERADIFIDSVGDVRAEGMFTEFMQGSLNRFAPELVASLAELMKRGILSRRDFVELAQVIERARTIEMVRPERVPARPGVPNTPWHAYIQLGTLRDAFAPPAFDPHAAAIEALTLSLSTLAIA